VQAIQGGLRRNSLGLLGVGTLGAVMLSPALGIYGNFAAMETTAGVVTSLLFIIAMVVALPSAISYAMIAKEMPAAGSAYTWLWRSAKPGVGLWVGWIMATYYVVVIFLQPIIFGLFFNEAIKWLGLEASNLTYGLGVLLATAIVMPAVYRDVNVSARTALGLMTFEMVTVLALSFTILWVVGGDTGLSTAPLDPSQATGGASAITAAALFGILSFTGFDVASTVAEEARTPKSLIPLATIIAVVVVGLFWIFTSWAFSQSVPVSEVAKLAEQGVTPITPIAEKFWHRGDIIVTITGLTASLGTYLAGMVAIGRVLFAMGRDDTAPRPLAQLHERYGTPWNALHIGFALVVAVCVVVAVVAGPFNVWVWCGSATVFFALVTYAFVHIGNFAYYRRYKPEAFHWFWNAAIPVFGLAVIAYALYRSFFVGLWGAGFAKGQSIVIFALAWAVLGVIYVMVMRRTRPEAFLQRSFVLGDDDDGAVPEATLGDEARAPA
jgi:amino acid transporter